MYNPWRGLRGLPVEIWVISAVTLVNRMGAMALPFLVLYLHRHLGFDAGLAGSALTVFGIGSLISAPVAGYLVDRIGAIRVMEGALLAAGIFLIVLPLTDNLVFVFGLIAFWAFFSEAVRPAGLVALTEDLPPDQRKAAIALNRLAINVGMSIGPAVGGFLAMVSFPTIFVVDGLSSLTAGLLLFIMARRTGLYARQINHARGERAPGSPHASATVLKDHRMLAFLAAMFLLGLIFMQHEASMPLHLVEHLGFQESFYGFLFVINTVLIILLEIPLNLAMASWPHARSLALGTLLIGTGFGAMALASTPWAIVGTVVIWTFGEMILFPSAANYVADISTPARRGQYMGAYTMAFGLALTIGPWLGTEILAEHGPTVLWSGAFVCGIVAALIAAYSARMAPVQAALRDITPAAP